MAQTNSPVMALIAAGSFVDVKKAAGRIKIFSSDLITMAAQASGDTIQLFQLPAGFIPLAGVITTDTSFGGTATIAIGNATTPAKYRAAATFATTDTPTLFGKMSAMGVALTAAEIVLLTIAAAALPGAGTFKIDMIGVVGD